MFFYVSTFLHFTAVCKIISFFTFGYCSFISLGIISITYFQLLFRLCFFISDWPGMQLSSSCYLVMCLSIQFKCVFMILIYRFIFGQEACLVFPFLFLHCSLPEFGFCNCFFPSFLGHKRRTRWQEDPGSGHLAAHVRVFALDNSGSPLGMCLAQTAAPGPGVNVSLPSGTWKSPPFLGSSLFVETHSLPEARSPRHKLVFLFHFCSWKNCLVLSLAMPVYFSLVIFYI